MAMSARERLPEYATLKALGFRPWRVGALIFTESLCLAAVGGAIGIAATFPVSAKFAALVGSLFRVFEVSRETVLLQAACALVVGGVAAIVPAGRAARVRIVDGLRAVA
jgi:putative ABC transport system permease protein